MPPETRDVVPGIDTHSQDAVPETCTLLRLFRDRLATAERLFKFYRLSESFVEETYLGKSAER